MWSPLLDELVATEQQRERLRLAEYARMVSAICDQAGPWRRTRRLMLRAIGYSPARIDGVVMEKPAKFNTLLDQFLRRHVPRRMNT